MDQKDPLEKGMATHSSILVWRIPWTEEPGGLLSMGSQRVQHDWATSTHTGRKQSESSESLGLCFQESGTCTPTQTWACESRGFHTPSEPLPGAGRVFSAGRVGAGHLVCLETHTSGWRTAASSSGFTGALSYVRTWGFRAHTSGLVTLAS